MPSSNRNINPIGTFSHLKNTHILPGEGKRRQKLWDDHWSGCLTAWKRAGGWWTSLSKSQQQGTVTALAVFQMHQVYGHEAINMTWTSEAWQCCPVTTETRNYLLAYDPLPERQPVCMWWYWGEFNLCPLQLVPVMVSVEICASPHLSRSSFNSQPLGLIVLISLLNKRVPEYSLCVLILQGSKLYAIVCPFLIPS